jgi:hypothetical protein
LCEGARSARRPGLSSVSPWLGHPLILDGSEAGIFFLRPIVNTDCH